MHVCERKWNYWICEILWIILVEYFMMALKKKKIGKPTDIDDQFEAFLKEVGTVGLWHGLELFFAKICFFLEICE